MMMYRTNVEDKNEIRMVYHDGTWNMSELKRLVAGELVDRNGRRYGMCQGCRTVIRVDKLLIGSLHICN